MSLTFYENYSNDINEIYRLKLIKSNVDFNDDEKCFYQYCNFLERLIKPKPRKVFTASSFKLPKCHLKAFQILENKILSGENINSYLSKRVLDTYFIDKLFNFDGLNHLHLSVNLEQKLKRKRKFTERSEEVLICLITEEKVIFIDIKKHGKNGDPKIWTDTNYLEILDQEFPDVIQHRKFDNLVPVQSTEQIEKCRNVGANYSVKTSQGHSYMNEMVMIGSDGKKTISGVRVQHVIDHDMLLNEIKKNAHALKNYLKTMKSNDDYEIKVEDIYDIDKHLFSVKSKLGDDRKIIISKEKII